MRIRLPALCLSSLVIACASSVAEAPEFASPPYILVAYAGAPIPPGPLGPHPDTLILDLARGRAQHRLTFELNGKIENAVTERVATMRDGKLVIDFSCLDFGSWVCPGIERPELGSFRGDTLEFVGYQSGQVTRTYVRR
ncbi:MAG: hypothetical protein ACO1Q7_15645 [Gemmatimonas sp.]